VDVSIINSIRRVILTEIPALVFRGFPHYSNKINIKKNNTKFNNEYLKHRISCVPIHVNDEAHFEKFKNNYEIRVSVVNAENKQVYVTTEDFKLEKVSNFTACETCNPDIFLVTLIIFVGLDFTASRYAVEVFFLIIFLWNYFSFVIFLSPE
jgi:DNA-directed RNA polymerase alpha subunit